MGKRLARRRPTLTVARRCESAPSGRRTLRPLRRRLPFKTRREGQAAVEAYVERVALDLVVEIEITHADEGKAERYRDIGVRELWRLHGSRGTTELRVESLALDPARAPRMLDGSVVLEGLAPADVCEAVDGVRFGETDDERREAVARIVRWRQRMSLRVREGLLALVLRAELFDFHTELTHQPDVLVPVAVRCVEHDGFARHRDRKENTV